MSKSRTVEERLAQFTDVDPEVLAKIGQAVQAARAKRAEAAKGQAAPANATEVDQPVKIGDVLPQVIGEMLVHEELMAATQEVISEYRDLRESGAPGVTVKLIDAREVLMGLSDEAAQHNGQPPQ